MVMETVSNEKYRQQSCYFELSVLGGAYHMYNLLIVDDEIEIREGLSAIPWQTMGVKLLGAPNMV